MADPTFTATPISADGTANLVTNPVFVQGTDGTNGWAIDGSGNLSVILAANSGVDIGDVDVTSVIPGTGATNLGKAEDAVAASGDTGVAVLAVRRDAASSGVSADGDYANLSVDSSGNLRTTASLTIGKTDDSAFTVATDEVIANGYLADETTPDSVDEGDIGIARMTLDRRQIMVLSDATTQANRLAIAADGSVAVTDNGGSLTVDGTVAATQSGTWNIGTVTAVTDITNVVSVDDNGGSLTVDNATLSVVGGGTEATALRVTIASDSTGVVSIDDGGGSITVDGTVTATNPSVKVDDAAFTVATDSITVIGALADETATDSVDEGDIGAVRMTLDRKLHTVIDDNGGSITVDNAALSVVGGGVEATALRVTIANDSTGVVSVDDNGGSLTVDGTVAATQSGTWNIGTVTTLTSITNDVNIADGGNSITVDAVQLDVDDLNLTDDAVRISGNTSANSETNPIFVQTVTTGVSGSEVHDYDTAASVAVAGTSNHDYTVTGSTFLLKAVDYAASGGMKIEVQVGPVASLVTKAVRFIPLGGGGDQIKFDPAIEVPVASTGTVRVIRTNRQGVIQDLYTTIIGNDV